MEDASGTSFSRSVEVFIEKSPRKELKHFFDRAENKRSHRHTINVLKVESKEKRKVRY